MLEYKDFMPEATPEEAAFDSALLELESCPLFARVNLALAVLTISILRKNWEMVHIAKIALASAAKEAHRQSQDNAPIEEEVNRPQRINFLPYLRAEEDDFTGTLKEFEGFSFATQLDYALFTLAKARYLNDWQCVFIADIALAAAVKIAKHGHC